MEKKFKYLSASRIKTLKNCSWFYWCNYHLKVPQPNNSGAMRGTICHLVFELLLNKRHKKHYNQITKKECITASPAIDRLVIKHLKKDGIHDEENYSLTNKMIVTGLNHNFFTKGIKLFDPEYEFNINNNEPIYNLYGFIDKWGIDAAYSGSQKCLSCPPGLSPITFSSRAVDKIRNRNTPVQSWFLDLSLVMDYWSGDGARSYHHTAPVNSMYALHESLLLLSREGLENSWKRHKIRHQELKTGFEKLGLAFMVEEPYRLPQMNSVIIPESLRFRESEIRKTLLEEYNLEIGSGLGALAGKIWRVGLMGFGASEENVHTCISALKQVL